MSATRGVRNDETSASLLDALYGALRKDLISGILRPGERLNATTMSREFGVSLSIVRETLARLSSEGLVTSEAQKGFRVAPVSAADLHDLTDARIEIERICLTRAIALGNLDWEVNIVAAEHRLDRINLYSESGKSLSPEWPDAHDRFHAALVAACDNRTLLDVREALFIRAERYRILSLTSQARAPGTSTGVGPDVSRPSRDVGQEHRDLAAAVMQRRNEEACTLIARHFMETRDRLLAELVTIIG